MVAETRRIAFESNFQIELLNICGGVIDCYFTQIWISNAGSILARSPQVVY